MVANVSIYDDAQDGADGREDDVDQVHLGLATAVARPGNQVADLVSGPARDEPGEGRGAEHGQARHAQQSQVPAHQQERHRRGLGHGGAGAAEDSGQQGGPSHRGKEYTFQGLEKCCLAEVPADGNVEDTKVGPQGSRSVGARVKSRANLARSEGINWLASYREEKKSQFLECLLLFMLGWHSPNSSFDLSLRVSGTHKNTPIHEARVNIDKIKYNILQLL